MIERLEYPVYIAMDFSAPGQVNDFLDQFETKDLCVKVGMELFYQTGPALLVDLKGCGCRVFLDLKLHDIPNTVKKAMKGIAGFGVDLVNVHAAGGKDMMEAALEGLDQGMPFGAIRPDCIAVTQLTSTNQKMMNQYLMIKGNIEDVTVSYARLAESAGLDGVVCSALEVPAIKKACGPYFRTVTPGIRLADDAIGDQARVATPKQARRLGSDALVVGRSVIDAEDPVLAYEQIKSEWSRAHE